MLSILQFVQSQMILISAHETIQNFFHIYQLQGFGEGGERGQWGGNA